RATWKRSLSSACRKILDGVTRQLVSCATTCSDTWTECRSWLGRLAAWSDCGAGHSGILPSPAWRQRSLLRLSPGLLSPATSLLRLRTVLASWQLKPDERTTKQRRRKATFTLPR